MAVATQRDLEFVIKVRDRSRDGFAAATVSVKQLTTASKAAGAEFDRLRTKATGLSLAVEKLRQVWSATAGVIGKIALGSGASMSSQSYSHFGAMMNSLSFGMINVAAKANLLPPRLNRALDALNLFMNGSDKLRTSLAGLAKHDNFWVRMFGSTALPMAQVGAIGSLTAAFRVLAGFEKKALGGGILFGPMIPYLEGMDRMFRGRLTEGVRKATDNFWGFGRALQWAATIMEVVKHPLTRLIVVVGSLAAAMSALNTIQGFERALYRVASVAGVPTEFLARVSQEIRRIGIEYGITATELTGAYERIVGAGFEGAEAFDMLRAAAMGAQFGMGTVVQTQDILSSIMAVYGDEVAGAQDALGLLLTAIREGKADADQFGASFGRVFGVARQAGLSLTELLSAVTVLSRTGLPAAEGVAAVRQAIGDLTAPSRQAMNIMRDLNISVEAVQRSLRERGLVETAREMLDVLSDASWTDTQGNVLAGNQLIARIFDQVEGRNAVLQWYDSLRTATDDVMRRVGETPANLAQDVWADMQDSVALAFDRFKAMLHDFQIGIGNVISGPIIGVMNFFTDNIQAISIILKLLFVNIVLQIVDWFVASRIVSGFFVFIGRFMGGLKILGINIGAIWVSIGGLGKRLLKFFSTPFNIGPILNALRNVVFSFRAAMLNVRIIAGQTREYMRLAALNPALALRMAVTASRTAAMAVGRAIGSGINAGFKAVKLGLTWFIGNLMDWMWTFMIFGEMFDAPFQVMNNTVKLASVAEGTFTTLGTVLVDVWNQAKIAVMEWYNDNKKYIDEYVANAVRIWTALQPVFVLLGNGFEGTVRMLPALYVALISFFQMIWNAITETIDFFAELWKRIVDTWNAIGNAINRVLNDIGWTNFARGAGEFFGSVADMAVDLTEILISQFKIMEIKFDEFWAKMGGKVSEFTSIINPGSLVSRALVQLFPEGTFERGAHQLTAEEQIAAERARLRASLESTSESGRLGRDMTRIWSTRLPDFSATTREFNEMSEALDHVGSSYRDAFSNDATNAARRGAERAFTNGFSREGYAQAWMQNVLAAENRRRAADDYVNGAGTSTPRGAIPDLSADPEDQTDAGGGGGNGRDPYADTVARLREAVAETRRMAKENVFVNAVKSAGLELQAQAVELGHSELVSTQELAQLAQIRGLVEEQDVRNRELRIEDYHLATEEAQRTLDVMRRISNPAMREAELAALNAEMALRRDKLDVTQEEIEAAREAARLQFGINHSRDLLQSTEQIIAETAAIREQMGVRFRSGEQYAVDNAVLQARNQLLRDGVDLLNADTQAHLAAVAARAAADYQAQHTSLGFLDTIRQRADETITQMGTVQQAVADGVMRLGQGLADTLFDAAMSGKQSFAEMTSSILADIARMITRMLVMKAIQSVMGGVPMFADGGVSSTPLEFIPGYAKGGAFTNSVVSHPTLFKFAKGSRMGLMGEAGPEAIMPLTKMPNGKLGVEATGGGGGSYVNVFRPEVHINVESTGNRDDDMAIATKTAKLVNDVMDHKMAEFERSQLRSSNRLGSSMRRPN